MTTSSSTRAQPASRPRIVRRLARAGVPLFTVICLLLGGAPAASAAPASPDPAGCSATLAKAAVWPGGFFDGNGTRRIYSDAFYAYLNSQPPCAGIQ